MVADTTKIKDARTFLGSTTTKDSLTLYPAPKLLNCAQESIIMATYQSILSYKADCNLTASSQEKVGALMIAHAVDAAKERYIIHIYSQSTDVKNSCIMNVPLLGNHAAMLMGTSNCHLIMLQPIYDTLGENKANALCK